MARSVIDLDSWATDAEPIELRIGGRPILIRSPTFERALRTAEECERINADQASGRIAIPTYVERMTTALLRNANFVGSPNWLGRWAVRLALRRLTIPTRLRVLQELYQGFAVSLGQWSRAVAGGTNEPNGASRGTGSLPSSDESATGFPESSGVVESYGVDSGDWPEPSNVSRPTT